MMPAVAVPLLPAMSSEALDKVRRLETEMLAQPQAEITTNHVFHAGLYARTIRIPAGVALTGALIKRTTLLIVSGECTIFTGNDTLHLRGYHVIPASAGRKQVFLAHADTDLTMLFPSNATTVEEAEAEFTDEADRLISRQHAHGDSITITGE